MARVALVTGGTRGIGAAIADRLSRDGSDVCVTYRENEDAAAEFQRTRLGTQVFRSDLCSDESIETLVGILSQRYGRLDILINNAGRVIPPSNWRDISRSIFLETLDTNLVGPCMLTRRLLPLLEKSASPAIVNIGSTYGMMGDPWVIAYSAAKAGLIQFTRALAKDLAPRIRVNAVLPGHVDTEMTRSGSSDFISNVISETPLNRLGAPGEIAELVSFLASDSAQFITGQTMIIDGGHVLR